MSTSHAVPESHSKDAVTNNPGVNPSVRTILNLILESRDRELGAEAFDKDGIWSGSYGGRPLRIRKRANDHSFWLSGILPTEASRFREDIVASYGKPTYDNGQITGWRLYENKKIIANIEVLIQGNEVIIAVWDIPNITYGG